MNDLYKFPSDFVSEQFVEYIDQAEIEKLLTTLANQINERYRGEEVVFIGVLKGCILFMSDLTKKLRDIKVYIDFMSLSSVGHDKENNGTILVNKDIKTNIRGKNVIIVEEIIDTGRALYFLKNRLLQAEPKNLEIVALFDKPNKRKASIKPDYIGKILDDKFVVGYGLDLEEYGRNISDLYYLKYPN